MLTLVKPLEEVELTSEVARKTALIFHSNNGRKHCVDGVGGAWVVLKYLRSYPARRNDEVVAFPCTYGGEVRGEVRVTIGRFGHQVRLL